MNAIAENMRMTIECADKLARLGEKLFNETEMKYRAGNKVRIKNLDWYNENQGMNGLVGLFTPDMKKLCGKIVTLDSAYNGKYTAIEVKGYYLDDSMIEGLVEEKKDVEEYESHKERQKRLYKGDKWSTEFKCPDGYEFRDENGNVIQARKIVLEKKKPEWPKTYDDCIIYNREGGTPYNRGIMLSKLEKLLICRDAYWKLAGDWKPDWAMYSAPKHCIIYSDNQIKWQGKSFVTEAKVLAFPTDMMRDFFYENFKDLIEECKELL